MEENKTTNIRTFFEFYYCIGSPTPSSAYRLDVEKETDKTYRGVVVVLRSSGEDNYSAGRFLVKKNESTLIRFPANSEIPKILVRIPCEDFEEAKARAAEMVKAKYEEWAKAFTEEENHPSIDVVKPDRLKQLIANKYGDLDNICGCNVNGQWLSVAAIVELINRAAKE